MLEDRYIISAPYLDQLLLQSPHPAADSTSFHRSFSLASLCLFYAIKTFSFRADLHSYSSKLCDITIASYHLQPPPPLAPPTNLDRFVGLT